MRMCDSDVAHIGMGSILMEGSYVEGGSMLGAGSLLLPHTRVPSGQVCEPPLALFNSR
jgi:carbonic anhydrase/acetyltransferase-like protein (isoleucine patch superfamily)